MKLVDWRKVNGMTQMETGRLLGVSQAAVARYEQGERVPAARVMLRIGAITNGHVEPNDFYILPDSPHPEQGAARSKDDLPAVSPGDTPDINREEAA